MFVNAKKVAKNVDNFLTFQFLSDVVPPTILSKASRPWKLRPTGLEVSSFKCSLFNADQAMSGKREQTLRRQKLSEWSFTFLLSCVGC